MRIIASIALTALLLVFIAGCQNSAKVATTSEGKLYVLRATVVAIDAEHKKVTLDHEDIPGLMRAMKMNFPVEDVKILAGLKAGDPVEGKLKALPDGKHVVTELAKRNQ